MRTDLHKHLLCAAGLTPLAALSGGCADTSDTRPNILFVIADDQSWPYASAYGCKTVSTPGFDYVAGHGALFNNAYVTSPGSSPSRASILTGLYPWQIEEAGTHASSFPARYTCYPDVFREAGYHVGYTGKGWGPGDWAASGREHNPAGPEYNECRLDPPYSGISKIDYAANFRKFLAERPEGAPFCFWLGTHEPHRPYENASWVKAGHALDEAEVPGFLPDADPVRGDILDYAVEIEWFDRHLGSCLEELERRGELDRTIVIVTADNGMSFPHAKANCYDAGLHVPLAVCWGERIRPRQVVESPVSLVDVFPTLLEASSVTYGADSVLVGESLLPLLEGRAAEYGSEAVYAGRERHSCSRYNNQGYPMRSIRSGNYLLVRNFHPERWPAGDPQALDKKGRPAAMHGAYYDIDAAPSKTYLIDNRENPQVKSYFDAAVARRPEFELYNLKSDARCLHNVADDPHYSDIFERLRSRLQMRLAETGDPRVGVDPEIWESYPRLEGKMRTFPAPKE